MKNHGFLLAAFVLLAAGCATTQRAAPAQEPAPTTARGAQADQGSVPPAQASLPAATATASPATTAKPAEASPPETTGAPPETAEPAQPLNHPSLLSAEALGIYRTPEEQQEPPTTDELAVIASAKTLLGKPPNAKVTVNSKQFTLDCIGTVSAIYFGVSLDVTKDFDLYTGNGVNRLYMTLKERNALHTDKYPRPGDVIIWSNTWDVGADDDRIHDPRTHAGIVLAVDEDGTIHYVHENLYKGVMIETMNLLRPTVARDEQGKEINSGMAIASKTDGPRPMRWLAGDVFDSFGDVLSLRDYFFVDLTQRDTALPGASAEVALSVDP
jgi:cell wall-associated NlpC family hydrolase